MFTSAHMYERFVGRYGPSLSRAHIAEAGIEPGDRVLDVGCGPGMLARALADLVGADLVAAVDPSEPFVDACRAHVPGADVRVGSAEELPDFGAPFDAVMSQLVVNFMSDAEAGVRAMRSAAREDGVVSSCVWDYAEGMTMLRTFWDAALELDPDTPDEARTMRYCSEDELRRLWERSGLDNVRTGAIQAAAEYESFADLWAPFPAGLGPAGSYCASLPPERQENLRAAFFERLGSPQGPFALEARAWLVVGYA